MTEKLLKRVKTKNRKAQKEFYDLYSERMFRLVYRYVSNEADASGIVNYGFFKIFNNIGTFIYKDERSMNAWIKKIMVNEALTFIRQTIKFKEIEEQDTEFSYNIFENNLELESYYNMIKSLPNDYRTVFNLYAIEGFSHKEVAEKLEIEPSSSRVYLTRARKLLQEKFNNHERK